MTRLLTLFVIAMVAVIVIYAYKASKNLDPSGVQNKTEENLSAYGFQDWHEFSAPNERFKVLMPSLPQHAIDHIKDKNSGEMRKYEMYVSEKSDGTIFMISVIHFPQAPTPKDKEVLLRTLMNDAMESNPKNKLLRVESSKYKTHDALDYSLENAEMNVEAKAFITNDTLYALTRLVKKQNYNTKEFDFFINSFDLSK